MRFVIWIETLIALGILVWVLVAPAGELGTPVMLAIAGYFAVQAGDSVYRFLQMRRALKELDRQ